jgi:hypothetical protein
VASLFVLYLIADRFVAVVTRWPQTVVEAVAPAHCEQFINIAKTAYGEMWRVRLDPRDTTCDREIKTEWERQQLTRYVPPPASLAPPAVDTAASNGPAAGAPAPQPVATRCLNVVSLAQAKYGAEWRTKLAVEDPECAGERRRKVEAPAVAPEPLAGTDAVPAAEPPAAVEPAPAEPATSAPVEAQPASPPAQ